MKKFFYKIKNAAVFFLWQSQKPFFTVFFILIFCLAVISFAEVFLLYEDTGNFFKRYDSGDFIAGPESEKIDLIFKNDGRMTIKKIGSFDLDFKKFSFVDQYYSNEYRVIFPGNFDEYFEREFFEVKNNFINSVSVSENEVGQTVLIIKEKDILAAEISEGKNELMIFFKEPEEIYDKIIAVDPGHGGMDFGVNDGENMEKDITLKICRKLERMFDGNDEVKIYLTRNSDNYVKDEERVFFANEYADLLISVHLCSENQYNFSDNTKIFYLEDETTDFDISPKRCAEILVGNLLKFSYTGSAEAISESKAEFKNTVIPFVFCELGYSDKYTDTDDFSAKAADGLYEAINEILSDDF